jgi:hypothetical protein
MDIKVSNGNSKIGKDTFILNITSATDCPTKKLGMCKIAKVCYALQPELRWTNKKHGDILNARRRQTKIWDSLSAKEIAEQLIGKAERKRKDKIKYLRVHESGDFRTQKDVDKMSEIADILKTKNIVVYGYTARKDLDYTKKSNNLILNGSYFTIDNRFVPVRELSKSPYVLHCKMNCRICNLCKESKGSIIENRFHGVAFKHN